MFQNAYFCIYFCYSKSIFLIKIFIHIIYMKHFKLSEFEKNGFKITDNTVRYNIENLVNVILDKTREYYGAPIYILEGYNLSSNHMGHYIGTAAEITTKSKQGNINIFEFIKSNCSYDELWVNDDYESIHVSVYPENRNQFQDVNKDTFESDWLVCLDSGHGKDTPGKCSPDLRIREWEWTREIKYRIIKELEDKRICKCFDVNPEDTEPGLTVRANRANNAWKDNSKKGIFVSIHINAAGNGDWYNAKYWSIWTSKGKTEADNLATVIWNSVNEVMQPFGRTMGKDMSDGDVDYESNFTVLTKTSMPAVLIENFFMDNKENVEFLLSEQGKQAIVEGIVNGIKTYLKSKK